MWAKQFRPSKRSVAFVRAGDQVPPARRTPAGIRTSAKDRQLLVDPELQLKFPRHIAGTTLQPDIVLVSESTKQAVQQEPGRSLRKKALHVCGTGQRPSAGWLENEMPPSGGQMWTFGRPFFSQGLQHVGHRGREEKESHPQCMEAW